MSHIQRCDLALNQAPQKMIDIHRFYSILQDAAGLF